jgi:hypothetical protein
MNFVRKKTRKENWMLRIFLAVCGLSIGCGAAPQNPESVQQWQATPGTTTKIEQDAKPVEGRFRTLLVVGVINSQGIRKEFEDKMEAMLKQGNVGAAASYEVLPEGAEVTREVIGQAIADTGIDAVLVTRLVAARDEKKEAAEAKPGQERTPIPFDGQGPSDIYGYYSHAFQSASASDLSFTERIVDLETRLFEVKEGKSVWSAVQTATNPGKRERFIETLCAKIIQELTDANLI